MGKAIETTTLSDGTRVLAKQHRGGYFGAATYANDSQAKRKAAELNEVGMPCEVITRGRVRFVMFKD